MSELTRYEGSDRFTAREKLALLYAQPEAQVCQAVRL
jgi:hypothetical protein